MPSNPTSIPLIISVNLECCNCIFTEIEFKPTVPLAARVYFCSGEGKEILPRHRRRPSPLRIITRNGENILLPYISCFRCSLPPSIPG